MRRTYFDWFLIVLTLIVFAGSLVYLLYEWSSIPEFIPIHFNLSGDINQYGNKSSIFTIVVLEAFLLGFIVATSFIPKFWNVPESAKTPITLTAVKLMLEFLGLVFAVFFTGVIVLVSRSITIPSWALLTFCLTVTGISFMPFVPAVFERLRK